MDYTELADCLRYYAAHVPNLSASFYAHLCQAADAIEELEFACNRYEKDYKDLCTYLPKWIPVTERLPNKKGFTLILTGGYPGVCYFVDGWWGGYEAGGITHWMPLPERPKEE